MKDITAHEDKLHREGELLDADLSDDGQWVQRYGTDDKQIAKHRKGRQEAVRDIIAGQKHHEKFLHCIEEIENVDEEDPFAHVRIAKWAKAAELRFKAMSKYVPDVKAVQIDVSPETQAAAEGISRAADLIGRIAGRGLQKDVSGTVPERPLVSAPVGDETEGPGGSS